MVWVGLFIIGLIGLIAGLTPFFLGSPSRSTWLATILGAFLLVIGAAGVIFAPTLAGAPGTVAEAEPPAAAAAPPAQPAVPPQPDSAPAAAAPAAASPPAGTTTDDAASDKPPTVSTSGKDVSQLQPMPEHEAAPKLAEAATPTPGSADQTPAVPAANPSLSPDKLAALADRQPNDEAAFTKALSSAKTAYQKAFDEGIQPQRAAALCKAVPKPEVKNWVGRIAELERDPGNRWILTVALPDGSLVKTWNNAMSDLDDKTLVESGAALAEKLDRLHPGDAVRFSGTFFSDDLDCYRSSRISTNQSIMEPSFIFRFAAVEKLAD